MNSDYQEVGSDMDYSDDCFEDFDYYNNIEDNDIEQIDPRKADPEYFDYECLSEIQVEQLLNETIAVLSNTLQITPSLAKVS